MLMPNKTIYVSDDDLGLYGRAQDFAGGNLSAAIATALRRYVDVEEGRREGFDEIIVRVGPGTGRKVRFVGVLLGQWGSTGWSSGGEIFYVYKSRSGKFVVHVQRMPGETMRDAEGKPAGWRGYLGLGEYSYGMSTGGSTIEVVDTLEALREKVPPELFEMVAAYADQPAVEDLDI